MHRELRRKTVKHGYFHRLLAVDIETNPANGAFICAGVFGDIRKRTSAWVLGKPRVCYKSERLELYLDTQQKLDDFLLTLEANSCLLIFYNLAYDKTYLNNIVAPYRIDSKTKKIRNPILHNGSRIISILLKNDIKGIDLFNHTCEGRLEDWIKYLDMEAKYGVKKESLDNLEKRVMSDAKATWYLGIFLQDFYYNECGIPFQMTVGASALRIFQQKFFTDYWERDSDFISSYERQSYYGGRAELFKRGKFFCYNYDVHSMYVSIMRDCLIPDPSSAKYIENGAEYLNHFYQYLGIYHCRVSCPDDLYIPILPVRQNGKLAFPTGEFEGTWCSVELQKAIEKGYKILQCYSYIYYRNAKIYFHEFALFVWDKRQEYTQNQGMDKMIKRIGNSLYGKFAQRNSGDFFGKLSQCETLPDVCEIFDVMGELWVRIKGNLTPAKFEFPCVSSFITAYARLRLYTGLEANQDSIIYCDTDSMKLDKPIQNIPFSGELGAFGYEGFFEYTFYRPKFYGEKCKGIPKNAKEFYTLPELECMAGELLNYKRFKYTKPLKEREAIRRKQAPNTWVDMIKKVWFTDDKRLWHDDGTSEPLHIEKVLTTN